MCSLIIFKINTYSFIVLMVMQVGVTILRSELVFLHLSSQQFGGRRSFQSLLSHYFAVTLLILLFQQLSTSFLLLFHLIP
jgi:hypothetical protein